MLCNQGTNFFIGRRVAFIAGAVTDPGMMRRAVPALADRTDTSVFGAIELREHVADDVIGELAVIVHNE